MNRIFILAISALLVGCKPSGPATTKTNSSGIATVAERASFLQQYVNFRHTYETLDFDIMYQNNGDGIVPGPSDWDVRIIATVPASEITAWIPAGVNATPAADRSWITSVPTTLDVSGINEWYVDGTRSIGVDRAKRIVVFRSSSN